MLTLLCQQSTRGSCAVVWLKHDIRREVPAAHALPADQMLTKAIHVFVSFNFQMHSNGERTHFKADLLYFGLSW